ncbi:sporulation protein Cse60 [Marinoscillum sp.]|uniref:sporulation protein Cse60 n=1 Tax=Marinoscillum sp. TaxID=2024838 RepID=UPI003BA90444
MIYTQLAECTSNDHKSISDEIQEMFHDLNIEEKDLIDIKFSTSTLEEENGEFSIIYSALIIYRSV